VNITEAATAWEEAEREIRTAERELAGAKARRSEAAEVLKNWFRSNRRRHWKNRIGFSITRANVLDQTAAKARLDALGELDEHLTERVTERLTLLDD
jgi:hypothetical protein